MSILVCVLLRHKNNEMYTENDAKVKPPHRVYFLNVFLSVLCLSFP